MASSRGVDGGEESQLRERLLQRRVSRGQQAAKEKVLELNTAEEDSGKNESEKKTYGRTPDGTGMIYNQSN
jgi:hypothetical protein